MLKNYSKVEVYDSGDKHYLNDKGEFHCLDGPAIERSNGSKFWYINDKEHRNIDPSDEYSYGEKLWYFKDKRHRVGGSCYSHKEWWFIHGEVYSKQDYFNKVWDI